ncbi:tRNA (cytidine(34)-2'-O)-methyltransferase [Lacticaseibacillus pantheris]
MTNHIVLYQPEIPQNTGNIARTCVGTGAILDIIKPMKFEINDHNVKRAGLDYWDKLQLVFHDSLEDFMATVQDRDRLHLITKFADTTYSDRDLSATDGEQYFMFGKETTGLPEPFLREYADRCLRIPMTDDIRALNLSNCAALVIYEALRQQNFAGLERVHAYPHDKLK